MAKKKVTRKELLKDTEHTFLNPTLKFHPYLLMEVKYSRGKEKTGEGLILWSLVDGEMVINTNLWEKTHGFADCIMAGADKDDYKVIKTLSIAKSAIRHNMAKDLPEMDTPTCIIWGKNDTVTPPEVAVEFQKHLPDSNLFWIDKCGHAPMMEHPVEFNKILHDWLKERNL